jgi:hypothetical protein
MVQPPSSTRATAGVLSYAQLASPAAKVPVPDKVPLRAPDSWRWIGKTVQRPDIPEKISGRAAYGVDTQLPELLVAVIARPPRLLAQPLSHDATAARTPCPVSSMCGPSIPVSPCSARRSGMRNREPRRSQWSGAVARSLASAVHRSGPSRAGASMLPMPSGCVTTAIPAWHWKPPRRPWRLSTGCPIWLTPRSSR